MKIAAVSPIEVTAYPRRGLFTLLRRVDVAFDDGAFLRIPKGFIFDGASIPPAARSFIQTLSTAGSVAFVIHDYAYSIGARYIAPNGVYVPISRQRADWIALALCDWLGLSCEDACKIYAGLRIGGESHFRKKAA